MKFSLIRLSFNDSHTALRKLSCFLTPYAESVLKLPNMYFMELIAVTSNLQILPFKLRLSLKSSPFAPARLCCPCYLHYYGLVRLPHSFPTFSVLALYAGSSPCFQGLSRVSQVPFVSFPACRSCHPGEAFSRFTLTTVCQFWLPLNLTESPFSICSLRGYMWIHFRYNPPVCIAPIFRCFVRQLNRHGLLLNDLPHATQL